MTETENRRNHEYSYNKYYTMPSREELHMQYGGDITEADFVIIRGKNQSRSINADKIGSAWSFGRSDSELSKSLLSILYRL